MTNKMTQHEVKQLVSDNLTALGYQDGELLEIRAIDEIGSRYQKSISSGFFDTLDDASSTVSNLDGLWRGIYANVNALHPDYRSFEQFGKMVSGTDTVTDDGIIGIDRIPVDMDVQTALGPKISSSNEEHDKAIDRATEVFESLTTRGFTGLSLIDSGNGAHVIIKVETLPVTSDLPKRVIKKLGELFDSERVKVDQTTYSLSQIIKLPGTVAKKGNSTDDRPHRRSKILSQSEDMLPTTKDLLVGLAGEAKDNNNSAKKTPRAKLDLTQWFTDHTTDADGVKDSVPYKDGLKWELPCIFNPAHNDRLAVVIQYDSGTIIYKCFHNSCENKKWQDVKSHFLNMDAGKKVDEKMIAPDGFEMTFEGSAERFFHYFADKYIFLPESDNRGNWLIGDKPAGLWKRNARRNAEADVLETLRMVQSHLLEMDVTSRYFQNVANYLKAQTNNLSRIVSSAEKYFAVLPNGDPVTIELFDQDPFLLNTPNGPIDLRTGEILEPDLDYYFTRSTAVAPGAPDKCPVFLQSLTEAYSDYELREYILKMMGQALTGSQAEKSFVIVYGAKSSGKSAQIKAISRALGSYAMSTPGETFLKGYKKEFSHLLAGHASVRFMLVSETDEGEQLMHSAIKSVTGDDSQGFRKMYSQDFANVDPCWHLFIATNFRPEMGVEDEALWDRLHVFPFRDGKTIDRVKQDKFFGDKLSEELPHILALLIKYAQKWYELGSERITKPKKAQQAFDDYFLSQNSAKQFLVHFTEVSEELFSEKVRTDGLTLQQAYSGWCHSESKKTFKSRAFYTQVEKHMRDVLGNAEIKEQNPVTFQGIILLDNDVSDSQENVVGTMAGMLN